MKELLGLGAAVRGRLGDDHNAFDSEGRGLAL